MCKRLAIIVLILGMVVTLFPLGTQEVSAQDGGSLATTVGFTVDPTQPGQLLQPGSVIYELNSGVTEVYGPDGTLTLSALDSQSTNILTSNGIIPADHTFTVPDGSKVVNLGKEIDIYLQNSLVLRVINQNITQPATFATHDWAEQVRNYGNYPVQAIDNFSVNWTVPSIPSNTTNQTAFMFNAFQSNSASGIVQPVLEWNQVINNQHSGKWTGAAWYMSEGQLIRDPESPVNTISVGDTITGFLNYDYENNQWDVGFYDINQQEHSFGVNDPGMTTTNVIPYLAYELWSPNPTAPTYDCSSYMPGDCTFTNITTSYNGTLFNVNWQPYYTPDNYPNGTPDNQGVITYPPCLNGLQVVGAYQGSPNITLKTTYAPALSVSTNAATNIAPDCVTLNGILNGLGSASNVNTCFVYATDSYWNANNDNYQYQTQLNQNINTTGPFTFNLTGLSPNTTYHYKAEVQGDGTEFGQDQTFTTPAWTVETDAASSINATSATLNAHLISGNNWVEGFVLDTISHPLTPVGTVFDPIVGHGGYDLWHWFQKDDTVDPLAQYLADINSDGVVNVLDLGVIGKYWNLTAPNNYLLFYRADIYQDGAINVLDTGRYSKNSGKTETYSNYPLGSFSVDLSNPPLGSPLILTPNTTYYYRAFAFGSNGWTWGNEVTFTTN